MVNLMPRGRPRQTHCRNGHDLAVHGAPSSKGGRFCRLCVTAYQAAYFQARTADPARREERNAKERARRKKLRESAIQR